MYFTVLENFCVHFQFSEKKAWYACLVLIIILPSSVTRSSRKQQCILIPAINRQHCGIQTSREGRFSLKLYCQCIIKSKISIFLLNVKGHMAFSKVFRHSPIVISPVSNCALIDTHSNNITPLCPLCHWPCCIVMKNLVHTQ